MRPVRIFYSYCREDAVFQQKLDEHLSDLRRSRLITTWSDQQMRPGTEWQHEIEAQLKSADIILLLVSSRYLNSNYCYDVEMKKALEQYHERGAHVLTILLSPTKWETTPLQQLPVLPVGGQPITEWQNQDKAFLNIADSISKIVTELQDSPTAEKAVPPTREELSFDLLNAFRSIQDDIRAIRNEQQRMREEIKQLQNSIDNLSSSHDDPQG
jgi:hypothetical protein